MQESRLTRYQSPIVRDLAWILEIPELITAVSSTPYMPDTLSSSHAKNDLAWISEQNPAPQPESGSAAQAIPVWTSADRLLPPHFFPDLRQRTLSALDLWDGDDRVLRDWIGSRPRRMGRYYEQLLAWLFTQDSDIDLVAADVAVTDELRTVGQFDFIIEYGGLRYHLEVAIKFYMQFGVPWNCAGMVGTDLCDRMDDKLAHMLHTQRALSTTNAGRATLTAVCDRPDTDRQVISMRGSIFRPNALFTDGSRAWLSRNEFIRVANTRAPSLYWTVLPRHRWFAPVRWDEATWYPADSVPLFELDGGLPSIMVAGAPHGGGELCRLLIVRNGF